MESHRHHHGHLLLGEQVDQPTGRPQAELLVEDGVALAGVALSLHGPQRAVTQGPSHGDDAILVAGGMLDPAEDESDGAAAGDVADLPRAVGDVEHGQVGHSPHVRHASQLSLALRVTDTDRAHAAQSSPHRGACGPPQRADALWQVQRGAAVARSGHELRQVVERYARRRRDAVRPQVAAADGDEGAAPAQLMCQTTHRQPHQRRHRQSCPQRRRGQHGPTVALGCADRPPVLYVPWEPLGVEGVGIQSHQHDLSVDLPVGGVPAHGRGKPLERELDQQAVTVIVAAVGVEEPDHRRAAASSSTRA